jgi:hypothetical protein
MSTKRRWGPRNTGRGGDHLKRLCKNCEFHEEVEGDYFCYRYPPRVVVIKGEIQSEYPPIDPKVDWCGEFKLVESVIEVEAVE